MSSSELVMVLGTALLHFLWQGLLIASLLALMLVLLRRSSAALRYVVRCSALLAMAVAFALTFVWLARSLPAPAPVASAASIAAEPDLRRWIVLAWAAGVLLLATRLLVGLRDVRRLRQRPRALVPAGLQRRFQELAGALEIRAELFLEETGSVLVPMTVGWIRPLVLLPARLLSGLSQKEVECLLAHELAHIHRHDYLANVIQSLLELVLFYHPAVWWVSRGIRQEREYCCDDLAVSIVREPLIYARALTELEGLRGTPMLAPSSAGGSLMSRIQRLLQLSPCSDPAPRHRLIGTAGALGLAVVLAGSAAAMATSVPGNEGDEGRQKTIRVRLVGPEGGEGEAYVVELEGEPTGRAHRVRVRESAGEPIIVQKSKAGAKECGCDCHAGADVPVRSTDVHEERIVVRGDKKVPSLLRLHGHDVALPPGSYVVRRHGEHALPPGHGQAADGEHIIVEIEEDDGDSPRNPEAIRFKVSPKVLRLHEHLKTLDPNGTQSLREHLNVLRSKPEALEQLHEHLQDLEVGELHEHLKSLKHLGELKQLEGLKHFEGWKLPRMNLRRMGDSEAEDLDLRIRKLLPHDNLEIIEVAPKEKRKQKESKESGKKIRVL